MNIRIPSKLVVTGALALAVVTGFSVTPARADTSASAALGAALGAFAGTLLFDSSQKRYYYVQNNHRYYVSNQQARSWYQRRDPHFYAQHQHDFANNPQRFAHDWQANHHG